MKAKFSHLACLTNDGSLLKSSIRRKELIAECVEREYTHVVSTDLRSLFRYSRFILDVQATGLQPVIGVTCSLLRTEEVSGPCDEVRLIAKNREGLDSLIEIVTRSYDRENVYKFPRIRREWLQPKSGLILLSGGVYGLGFTSYSLGHIDSEVEWLGRCFRDDWYLEVQPARSVKQSEYNTWCQSSFPSRTIATAPVRYMRVDQRRTFLACLAIDRGRHIDEVTAGQECHFLTTEEMHDLESQGRLPTGSVDNVSALLEKCESLEMEKTDSVLKVSMDIVEEAWSNLQSMKVEIGEVRYPEYVKRLEHEMSVISDLGFKDYFASIAEVINHAKGQDWLVGPGRGSVGGSLLAYLLGITQFDPMQFEHLLFERFLAPGRVAPPDIDWDIERRYRPKILSHVSDKYRYTTQIGTFNKIHGSAAIKDTARALGIPYGVANQASKAVESLDDVPSNILELMLETDPRWLEIARSIEGLVRHFSVHAAGVVISDNPIKIPLAKKASGGDYVVQVDKDDLEDIHGLLKYDYLGLNTLDKIAMTIELLRETQPRALWWLENVNDVWSIDLADSSVYKLLCRGDTANVFQMEKRSFAEMCVRLQPDNFNDIMAANALHRPGAMDSGQHDLYIARKHGDTWDPTHPDLVPILGWTYGIILYQEQIMAVSREFAGYDALEADNLRKIVGKKLLEKIDAEGEKFVQCAKSRRGRSESKAKEIFELIKPAARYSWNQAHACIAQGTRISGTKIEDIKPGQLVWSINEETLEPVLQPVVRVFDNGAREVLAINVDGVADPLCVTHDHRMLTSEGYKEAKDIVVGDSIERVCFEGQFTDGVAGSTQTNEVPRWIITKVSVRDDMVNVSICPRTFNLSIGNPATREATAIVPISDGLPVMGCPAPQTTTTSSTGFTTGIHGVVRSSKDIFTSGLPAVSKYSPSDGRLIDTQSSCDEPLSEWSTTVIPIKIESDDFFGDGGVYFAIDPRLDTPLFVMMRHGVFFDTQIEHGDDVCAIPTLLAESDDGFFVLQDCTSPDMVLPYNGCLLSSILRVLPFGLESFAASFVLLGHDNSFYVVTPDHYTTKAIHRTSRVLSIDEVGTTRVYDLEMPRYHNFAAGYGGLIAHNCAYSYISYVTAYLKANYPAEYFAATMAIENDLTKIPSYAGDLQILLPDINKSDTGPTIENRKSVRLGLSNIKGVGEKCADRIVRARILGGEFEDPTHLRNSVSGKYLNSMGMQSLWKSGALDSLGLGRDNLTSLQRWLFERQLCGTSDGFADNPLNIGHTNLKELHSRPLSWVDKIPCFISGIHPIKTKNDKRMAFITIEDATGEADLVCFPSEWYRLRNVIKVGQCFELVLQVQASRDGSSKQLILKDGLRILENDGLSAFKDEMIPPIARPIRADKWKEVKNSSIWDVPIAVTDIETTGLDHKGRTDRILEIATVIFKGGKQIDSKCWIIDPCRPIPEEATSIHGIGDSDVVGKPLFHTIVDEWLTFIDGSVLCGHNFKSFDRHFIKMEMLMAGYRWPNIPIVDTMTMVRRYDKPHSGKKLPTGWLRLGNACGRHGIQNTQAHRAEADCVATGKLLYALARTLSDSVTVGVLAK